MDIALIVILYIVALIVIGVAAFELVGCLVERKAFERFEKMPPKIASSARTKCAKRSFSPPPAAPAIQRRRSRREW